MKLLTKDNGRLESFSDGVFAFAATLLVVSLEVPDSFDLLKAQLSGFISFGVSFGALVLIWRTHYNYFRRTTCRDNVVVTINMILLFVVLYFVYPLKFLAMAIFNRSNYNIKIDSANDLAELFILYGIGFTLIFLCFAILYWRSAKKDIEVKEELLFYKRHFLIFAIIGCLSIILAIFEVGIKIGFPGVIYGLLGPICYIHGKWTSKNKVVDL